MIIDFTMKLAEALLELESSMTSVILLGEYPHPVEEDYE